MKRIAVGVDDSPGGRAALVWALDEARQWQATLDVVIAWSYLLQPIAEFRPDFDEAAAVETLDAILAHHRLDDVTIERTVINDLPAKALLHAAGAADLMVVGARGFGGFTGLLLGSVSQQVVTHAPCPVVVVRV